MKIHGETYLFYLQLTSRPDELFLHMSRAFHQNRIRLIPVTPEAFKQLLDGTRKDLLVVVADLMTYKAYLELKKTFLNYYVKTNGLRLFELSSFGKTSEFYRQEKKGLYYHFPLPCETLEVLETIRGEMSRDPEVTAVWPGGRRSRLPAA